MSSKTAGKKEYLLLEEHPGRLAVAVVGQPLAVAVVGSR